MPNVIHATISINDAPPVRGELNVETEIITVESATATKPDPAWEHVDPSGHFHAYASDGKLPTLVARDRHVACTGGCGGYFDDDVECEGYTVTEYYCLICDAEVTPGRIPDHGPHQIQGRTSWEVTADADVPRGERVSVRVTTGDRESFGVAEAVGQEISASAEAVRVTTRLVGVSPLGQRRRARAAA